ncbi:hypothetical protein D9M70_481030 [compost metagenome]
MNQRANENHFLTDESYRLEDRYLRASGRVFLTGTQALVRILLEQARADRVARLRTGGLVSGYRGSPLGGLDQELWRQRKMLAEHDIRFEPGLNEDLGATMLWGAQQIDAFQGSGSRGCSRCGTARGRALTGPATYSAMPISLARRATAACWQWRGMTTRRSLRCSRIRPTTCSKGQ